MFAPADRHGRCWLCWLGFGGRPHTTAMSYYYTKEDFEAYKEAFKDEADSVTELMLILNSSLEAKDISMSTDYLDVKVLFDMATEIRYHADNLYKKRKGIVDQDTYSIFPKEDSTALISEMRNLLTTELQKVFPKTDD